MFIFRVGKQDHQIHWFDDLENVPSVENGPYHISSKRTILCSTGDDWHEYSISAHKWKRITWPKCIAYRGAMSLNERYFFNLHKEEINTLPKESEVTYPWNEVGPWDKVYQCVIPSRIMIQYQEMESEFVRKTDSIVVQEGLMDNKMYLVILDDRERARLIVDCVLKHWFKECTDLTQISQFPDHIKIYASQWIPAEMLHYINFSNGAHRIIPISAVLASQLNVP